LSSYIFSGGHRRRKYKNVDIDGLPLYIHAVSVQETDLFERNPFHQKGEMPNEFFT